jgi:transposase
MDEAHFQQQGTRCRMWIPPEEKSPVVLQEPTRKSVGYFGAVRIRDGKFIFEREEQVFNAETTWSFLKKLRRAACHSGKPVAVIIDNARYHHATMHKKWRNDADEKFKLIYLSPYSPELNPIERIWKLTRRKKLHNQYFPNLEGLKHNVEELFQEWHHGSEDLRRLCKTR